MSVVVVIIVVQNTGRTVVLSFSSGLMQSSPDFLWSFFSGFHSFSIQRPECFEYLNQIPTQDHSLWGHSLPFEVWPFKTVQLNLQVLLISQVFAHEHHHGARHRGRHQICTVGTTSLPSSPKQVLRAWAWRLVQTSFSFVVRTLQTGSDSAWGMALPKWSGTIWDLDTSRRVTFQYWRHFLIVIFIQSESEGGQRVIFLRSHSAHSE